MLGEIVAEEIRLTFGVDVDCNEKPILFVTPVGVVMENLYDFPVGPGGTFSKTYVVLIDIMFKGKFITPVEKANLLKCLLGHV